MALRLLSLSALFLVAFLTSALAQPGPEVYTLYDNVFVDPQYITSNSFNSSTKYAQQSIVTWAEWLASQGPWSVLNKTIVPPSGDIHDYESWAPYSWPNCTGVGNTTQLTPEQVWTTCPYYTRDGVFNPDRLTVNDTGHFQALADTVLYSAIAWKINGSSAFSATAASFIDTWFLDPTSAMNPNLNYAQMTRGPGAGQNGTHTGVLDLKCMTKIVSAILILREGNSPDWTSTLDTQMINWTNHYIGWLTSANIALQEAAATNNHGTYYYNQLASLQILVNDTSGALATVKKYFSNQYLSQINSTGDQPLEASRTRPYHYRCYNLAAMITNARIGQFLGWATWDIPTRAGTNIQSALNFTMTVNPGNETASELYPDVADVASIYGDPTGRYAAFLDKGEPTYPLEPYFLWDQPLSNSHFVENATTTTSSSVPSSSSNGNTVLSPLSRLSLSAHLAFVVGSILLR